MASNEGYNVEESLAPTFLFLDSYQQGLYVYIICLNQSCQANEAADAVARLREECG